MASTAPAAGGIATGAVSSQAARGTSTSRNTPPWKVLANTPRARGAGAGLVRPVAKSVSRWARPSASR
jgi:hypothetical protein